MSVKFVQRWIMGEGGFIGEVSLYTLSEQDAHVRGRDTRPYVELTNLHIHPLRRGKGWADSLITAALCYAKRHGYCVFLRCVPYNKPRVKVEGLIQMYSKHGFRSLRHDRREMVRKWPTKVK